MGDQYPYGRRGFAGMSPDKQREIASKGGRAAHRQGSAHEWNADEARQAGRKGGLASRGGRGKLAPESQPTIPADPPLLRSKTYQPRSRRRRALTEWEAP